MQPPLPPLKPISIKDRVSVLFRVSHVDQRCHIAISDQ